MNKRARLARRILRDHRRGEWMHPHQEYKLPGGIGIWGRWACPHCPPLASSPFAPDEVPNAYR